MRDTRQNVCDSLTRKTYERHLQDVVLGADLVIDGTNDSANQATITQEEKELSLVTSTFMPNNRLIMFRVISIS